MKPTAPLALALCLTLPLASFAQQPAQQPTAPFTDPANLAGQRVAPLNGHELPIDGGDNHAALGLAQLLRRLNTRASILNIVAHPDDEDGGMFTLYSRGLGARVADLALTRGEGGQNFVTSDFEDALGLIRTQELLANDRYTGVSQLFGTEVDFGFSKTREEAFQKWTHQRVLYDAVRAIRIIRPLVITATFIGNVTDGHGQHQVSGEIAQEAFKAAADPTVFPDMIRQGILPWQALKVYARVPFATIDSKGVYDYATNEYVPARFTNYVTGRVTTTKPNADVTVPEGTTDPLLTAAAASPSDIPSTLAANPSEQLSYLQFARIGLGLQRTQISRDMRLPVSGMHNSGYTLYGSVLCNAPATARFPLKNSVILSEAKDPCILPAAAVPSGYSSNTARPGAPSSTDGLTVGQGGLSFAVANDRSPQPHLQSATLSETRTANTSAFQSEARTAKNSVILSEARTVHTSAFQSEARSGKNSVILSEGRSPQSKDPCILPAAALPSSSANTSNTPQNLSSRLKSARTGVPIGRSLPKWGGIADVAERPATPPASPQPSEVSSTAPTSFPADNQVPRGFSLGSHGPSPNPRFSPQGMPSSTPEPAPTARPITAQGEALGNHKEESQRAESPIQDPTPETQPNFFTGIDTSIEAIATLAPNAPPFLHTQLAHLQAQIATATRDFNPANPSTIAPTLAAALHTTDDLINRIDHTTIDRLQKENVLHELRIKRVQLNDALALALGLHLDATNSTPTGADISERTHINVDTTLSESAPVSAQLNNETLQLEPPSKPANGLYQSPMTYGDTFLHQGTKQSAKLELAPEFVNTITQPYFTRDNIEQPVYQLRNPALRNAPQTPAPLTAWATVTYQGAEITLGRIVH